MFSFRCKGKSRLITPIGQIPLASFKNPTVLSVYGGFFTNSYRITTTANAGDVFTILQFNPKRVAFCVRQYNDVFGTWICSPMQGRDMNFDPPLLTTDYYRNIWDHGAIVQSLWKGVLGAFVSIDCDVMETITL